MGKHFKKPFDQNKKATPLPPTPKPWQALLAFDPANSGATQLQFLGDAQPRLDDVIRALGELRDVALGQRGAMLMQQQLAAQQKTQQDTPLPTQGAPSKKVPAPKE